MQPVFPAYATITRNKNLVLDILDLVSAKKMVPNIIVILVSEQILDAYFAHWKFYSIFMH